MSVLMSLKDTGLVEAAVEKVLELAFKVTSRLGKRPVFMEVCGTHTVSISRSGLRGLLKEVLELKSGPGCPVCVTCQEDIDKAIEIARLNGVTIATFGDMLRVPGSVSSLEIERATGADIRIMYSPLEAVTLAQKHPDRQVVLLGVGFETTTPLVALSIKEAMAHGVKNFSVLSLHKTVPQVLKVLLEDRECTFDGLLLPGHVCAITGRRPFDFIAQDYGVPAAVTGFEPFDILAGLEILLGQVFLGQPLVANAYKRLVTEDGNELALTAVKECFEPVDAVWRGLGKIPSSGLGLTTPYELFDAALRYPVEPPPSRNVLECRCGDLLKGRISPPQCPLFKNTCTPCHPVGPCMVSSEGACAAYYQYDDN
ncbi:hydrogenase formation protein HypD [Desulfosporosinus sp. Sb-LF]|uniref:hydrogenase formation protein HypD n=1 Tax=Desulfosporosinus sp. Sb-LF TaxID=2560027 RepID=UPI00107F9249|nr:hydrogenase formation protein HypD [Desulfosporosinus sp. Sb-LF]TGE31109.1 hydrogenase formation protein HypD [Desulfosporosinus sp. Sb-LF]